MKTLEIRRLLRLHARTFALTLRFLPRSLREPLGLAYLLARASDTITDSGAIPLERRIALLEELRSSLDGDAFDIWQPKTYEGELSNNDGELICAVPQLIASLKSSPDCKELISLWQSITKGQLSDLTRFPSEAPLKEEELERYCFLVAGSVGEIWTKLIAKHEPQTLLRPEEEMRRLGIAYGKGLQLVNILRDLPADLRQGRCYVPAEALAAQGLTPGDLRLPGNEPRARAVYDRYLTQAEAHLAAGWAYTNALPRGGVRVRLACAWPILIGLETLKLLRCGPILDPAQRVKVSRSQVKRLIWRSVLYYPSPTAWRRLGEGEHSTGSQAAART